MTTAPVPVDRLNEVDPESEYVRILTGSSARDKSDWVKKYLTVPTPTGQIVKMNPFPQQDSILEVLAEDYRSVVVKGRQTRASSIIKADFVRDMTNGTLWGATAVVGANDDATTALFRQRILHHIFNDLNNSGFSFKAKVNNDNELVLDGLENRFKFISGMKKVVVRGFATQRVHLSEFAHWDERTAMELVGGLLPAVPGTGKVIIESTPKGEQGAFYEYAMGKRNEYSMWKTHLFPWWLEPRYRVTSDPSKPGDIIVSPAQHRDMMANFQPNNHEMYLQTEHGLDTDQILWRRIKQPEQDRTDAPFLQEYVEDLESCWLGVQGKYFDVPDGTDHVLSYRQAVSPPVRLLDTLTYKGDQVPFYGQNLALWEMPDQNHTYVIGFDSAGGGMNKDSDWSVAYVLDVNKEKVVARIRVQAPPRNFAAMLAAVATLYKGAMISGERSHHGKAVFDELMALRYSNIYYHVDPMKGYKSGAQLEPGMYPTVENRNRLLDKLRTAIVNHALETKCSEFVREMGIFTWQKVQNAMRPAAIDGVNQHDDCIFAMANAWFIIDKARNRISAQQESLNMPLIRQSGNVGIVLQERDMGLDPSELWRWL